MCSQLVLVLLVPLCGSSLLPVRGGPGLGVEEFWIEVHVATNLGVLFGGYDFAVDHEDYFGGNPAAAKFLILVELGFLRLRSIFPRGTKHANEIKILLIDPELRRMQVARFRPDDVNGSSLPRVFPELREVKLQCLQFRGHFRRRHAIDVESQDQKRMLERARVFDFAVFENVNLAVRKQDSVAFACRREVDAQTAGNRHRLVPGFDPGTSVRCDVCCFLDEGRGLVPRLPVLFLHGRDQIIRIRDLRVRGEWQCGQKNCE
jgi:hypothetical protein